MKLGTISIIMASFNGASYISAQLVSIAAQTVLPDELIIGDDGSYDESLAIARAFAATSPFRVTIVTPESDSLGACGNFARLLEKAQGEYVLFCDQDDVWIPGKIETSLAAMHEAEHVYGVGTPCLVHTDLRVISENGAEISRSFWKFQYLDPVLSTKLAGVLAQNVVTGCTVMINRALVELVLPFPQKGPLMHDWWLSLAVTAFNGQIRYLDSPTVLYRQHDANQVGAKAWSATWIMQRLFSDNDIQKRLRATQEQAAAFLDRYGRRIPEHNRVMISEYASLSSRSRLARQAVLLRHGIKKSGWQRTLGMYFYV